MISLAALKVWLLSQSFVLGEGFDELVEKLDQKLQEMLFWLWFRDVSW